MTTVGLLPAYLVVGENQLKRETAVSRLRKRADEGFAAFNVDERTAGADMTPTDIAISLNTLPVGSGFRLVLIHEAERLPKPVSETIISYLSNPNPDCVLCLVANKLAKSTRLYKAVNAVGKSSVIDCTPIKGYKLPSHLAQHAKALGIQLDIPAAQEMVSRVGESMVMLDQQLKTLAQLCAPRTHITRADVETYVARTAEVKPFEFVDKLTEGDVTRALELYRHMQKPSHHALLALITRRIRDLMCIKSMNDRGQSNKALAELGRPEWQMRSALRAAHRFSAGDLVVCLRACATCERELKTGAEEQTAFFKLMFTICNPSAATNASA